MVSSIWQRVLPYLDIVGAVLIFGSWISSNSLSQQAQDRANSHAAIVERVRHFRLYEDFAQRIRDIQTELAETHDLVETSAPRESAEPPLETLIWTGMTAPQVRELKDFIAALEGYAGQLSPSESRTRLLETARENVETLSGEFRAARDDYEGLAAGESSDPAAEEANEEEIDRLWAEFDAAKQNMLEVGDQVLAEASAEAGKSGRLAKQFKRLSYLFYVVGTLMILAGRAEKVRAARAEGEKS